MVRCGPAWARVPSNARDDACTHAHIGLCVQIAAERSQARPRPDLKANYLYNKEFLWLNFGLAWHCRVFYKLLPQLGRVGVAKKLRRLGSKRAILVKQLMRKTDW